MELNLNKLDMVIEIKDNMVIKLKFDKRKYKAIT